MNPDAHAPATFPLTTAQALSHGWTPARLYRSGLVSPHHGMRATAEPTTLEDRCRNALVVAPSSAAICGRSAGILLGLWLPRYDDDLSVVHVMRHSDSGRIRRPGICDHPGVEHRTVIEVNGIRVVCPADTWADLAGGRPTEALGRVDLIAVGDGIVADSGGVEDLTAVFEYRRRKRMRGVASMRGALALVRSGSKSRPESVTRVHIVDAGLPEPEVNGVIVDAHGEWLAEGDLVFRAAKLVIEYQSEEHHAAARQRSRDESRRMALEAQGWKVMYVYARDIFDASRRTALMSRIRGELSARGGLAA